MGFDRIDVVALTSWAQALCQKHGMEEEKAIAVASVLVEGDLLGHDTHGLALLTPYLAQLDQGGMIGRGPVGVISAKAAAELWDGQNLPGPWLVTQAIEVAKASARDVGTCCIAIRRSSHIGCLASYLEAPAREGFLVEIHCSDPSVCSVAPFGGKRAVFTPNPMAFGIPNSGDPTLIDISSSITTNGMSGRLAAAGERFSGKWLLDADGFESDDPKVFEADPPGTIQLLGGMDAGHKGYGLTLLVEALTGGLAGYGRADHVKGWGATVMVRVTDTSAFSGRDGFDRQMDWITDACHETPEIDPAKPVRMPGERGLARKREALAHGLALNPLVLKALEKLAIENEMALP